MILKMFLKKFLLHFFHLVAVCHHRCIKFEIRELYFYLANVATGFTEKLSSTKLLTAVFLSFLFISSREGFEKILPR